MKLKTLALAVSLLALPVTGALAQKTTYAQRHSINARKSNQQARIAHGVSDGQITPKGAAAAERNQARISSEEHADRAADGVTSPRRTVTRSPASRIAPRRAYTTAITISTPTPA